MGAALTGLAGALGSQGFLGTLGKAGLPLAGGGTSSIGTVAPSGFLGTLSTGIPMYGGSTGSNMGALAGQLKMMGGGGGKYTKALPTTPTGVLSGPASFAQDDMIQMIQKLLGRYGQYAAYR